MTPINEFLISKEMTATDLLNLNNAQESAFWDEYKEWREVNVSEAVQEEIHGETLSETAARLATAYPLDTIERAVDRLLLQKTAISSSEVSDAVKAARLDRIIEASVYS